MCKEAGPLRLPRQPFPGRRGAQGYGIVVSLHGKKHCASDGLQRRPQGPHRGREFIERPVAEVVEVDLRERAEAQLAKNKRCAGELRRKYLLSGPVRCGICGHACAGRNSTERV